MNINDKDIIRFKYNMNPDLIKLCREAIIEYDYDYLYGAMHRDISNQLNHASLYLICQDKEIQGNQFYANPLAIVAKNDVEAIGLYQSLTGNNGISMCELERVCNTLKVEMI